MRIANETLEWLRIALRQANSDAQELVEKGADQEDLEFQYGKAAAFRETLDYITERGTDQPMARHPLLTEIKDLIEQIEVWSKGRPVLFPQKFPLCKRLIEIYNSDEKFHRGKPEKNDEHILCWPCVFRVKAFFSSYLKRYDTLNS